MRVSRVKEAQGGEVGWCNAEIVAEGFSQIYGTDYKKTFTLMVKLTLIRKVHAKHSQILHPMDFKTAFHGALDEDIYHETAGYGCQQESP